MKFTVMNMPASLSLFHACDNTNTPLHDFIEKEKKSRKTDTQNSNMIEQQSQQSKKKTNPRAKKNEPLEVEPLRKIMARVGAQRPNHVFLENHATLESGKVNVLTNRSKPSLPKKV